MWKRWPKPGGTSFAFDAVVDDRVRGLLHRLAAAHERQPAVEEPHARLDVAAVVRPEGQDAGGDAVLERRARRRDVARRQRRRRRHAVIDRRHQHGVQHPADRRRRQLAHQQQIDRFGERQPAHHLVERVAADEDLVRRDRRQRRSASGRRVVRGLRAALDRSVSAVGSAMAQPRVRRGPSRSDSCP